MAEVVVHLTWQDHTTFTFDDEHIVRRDGEKLGEQGGDFQPFVIDLDGERYFLVAGDSVVAGTRYVYVNEHPVPVNPKSPKGLWMAPPLPFSEGMTVTVVGKAAPEGDELWRLESPPLAGGENPPVIGPGWTRYAPLR